MNAKAITPITTSRQSRARFNPIRNLRPDTLANALESFEAGRLGAAARIFEAILKRDDVICGLNLKRKKSVARLESEIVVLEDSPRAQKHKAALEKFYGSLEVKSYTDKNERGGLRMLVSQMMDCVAMRYCAHKISLESSNGELKGVFEQYPLWLFENTSGKLRLLEREGQLTEGVELEENSWMVTCGDGLMVASSIAYIFKQLPLRDWLIYCERNGMPGIKAKTDAYPDSPQWDAACEAVRDFGAEFHAVLSEGTDIEAIDVSTRGELPYPALIERVDRMLCALWRGSDLSTVSGSDKVGASVQWYESTLIEEADAANIGETLNSQGDAKVIYALFGDETPLAKIRLKLPDYEMHKCELDILERLVRLGLKPDTVELAKRFAFPISKEQDTAGSRKPDAKDANAKNADGEGSGAKDVESEGSDAKDANENNEESEIR